MLFVKLEKILVKIARALLSRVVIVGVLLLIQVGWIALMIFWLAEYSTLISAIFVLISIIAVCYIINKPSNPTIKLVWVILIAVMPLFGGLLYIFLGGKRPKRRMRRELGRSEEVVAPYRVQHPELIEEVREDDPPTAGQLQYLADRGYPAYRNTEAEYFPFGEDNYPVMLEELKKAKHYIFLEYFIIQDGVMWSGILEILKEKVAEGLDVRILYDDVGSLFKLPASFYKEMEALGIKCIQFSPFIPFLSIAMNNRDHRKIMVIDGHTGFTGGINLADEYINVNSKVGRWKDTGVVLRGDAVWSLTLLFLKMWNAFRPTDEDLDVFRPHVWREVSHEDSEGLVIPYADSPMEDEILAENVYLNLINSATRYVYIFTPYLIIDHEVTTALCLAAKRGVDVRIITPGIPDKKTVYAVTRAHYPELLDAGVRIYEYTPGFDHAKCVVVDDKLGTVGSINFDYRSLYLHFECGTLHYKNKVVRDIRDDFVATLPECREVTGYHRRHLDIVKEVYYAVLRLIAPLL